MRREVSPEWRSQEIGGRRIPVQGTYGRIRVSREGVHPFLNKRILLPSIRASLKFQVNRGEISTVSCILRRQNPRCQLTVDLFWPVKIKASLHSLLVFGKYIPGTWYAVLVVLVRRVPWSNRGLLPVASYVSGVYV